MGHRPEATKGSTATSRSTPSTPAQDLRGEMRWPSWASLAWSRRKHHHEVAPAQHEARPEVLRPADHGRPPAALQIRHPQRRGRLRQGQATFMAKPYFGDNGSGMHVHQSIWAKGKPCSSPAREVRRPLADLPPLHRRHHQARQGHQRLLQLHHQLLQAPGPRLRGPGQAHRLSSARNRIRLPSASPTSRAPRPSASRSASQHPMGNPYLTFVALLMAGLGTASRTRIAIRAVRWIRTSTTSPARFVACRRRSPRWLRLAQGGPRPPRQGPRLPQSRGGVFDDDFINAYIDLKLEEVARLQLHPHPVEFDMYFKC